MSLADFYKRQCLDKLEENVALALAKLSDPSSLVQTNIGDLLQSGSGDGQGGLGDYAATYLKNNAQGLVLAALKATGKENTVLDGLNLFLNMLAQLMAAYNDMILLFLKEQARNCVKELTTKISLSQQLKVKLTTLVNVMTSLDKGDPVYDAYLAQLRSALVQLDTGRRDLRLARNTLAATSQFQPKVYRRGRNNVRDAVKKIKPPTDSSKVIIPSSGGLGAVERGGVVTRARPNLLLSSKGAGDTKFASVRVGDTVTVTIDTGSTYILLGTYTVSALVSSSAVQLDRNVFNVAKVSDVNEVTGVTYYVTTIVKGVGAAVASAVLKDLGLPTSADQIENIMAMPTLIKQTIGIMRSYMTQTLQVNTLLGFYERGLSALLDGLPDIMKGYVLSLFDPVLTNLSTLISSMALTLNNDETRITADPAAFRPQPLGVATHSFKWSMDGSLIVEAMKLIPASVEVIHLRKDGHVLASAPRNLVFGSPGDAKQFTAVKLGDNVEITAGDRVTTGSYTVMRKIGASTLQLDRAPTAGKTSTNIEYTVETDGPLGEFQANQEIVNVYKSTVAELSALGNIGSGSAALFATAGQEQFAPFSATMLAFLLQAASGVVSASTRKAVISLGKALIARCDVAISRDQLEQQILTRFINTPIPLEDTLNQLLSSLKSVLSALGLDKAADALANGDYAKLFGMNSKNATYVGAAVEAIAFLKACFDDDATKSKLEAAENDLQGQKDLFSIKLSFDFDFAILKNIQDCLNLNNLANLFASKEAICSFIKDAAPDPGKQFDKLESLVTGSDASGQTA